MHCQWKLLYFYAKNMYSLSNVVGCTVGQCVWVFVHVDLIHLYSFLTSSVLNLGDLGLYFVCLLHVGLYIYMLNCVLCGSMSAGQYIPF